ncbi:hypothetical protein [Phytohabitans suffuscus]|uniref:Uncharacterized protein n=1 Tax=Phytohabitans suffuscus TaxID=624315 RepID=A0A6F8YAN3_9ACTN|nr:hypothetical protein [Phytohabitans suffuscus]BCB83127.1 hypothetical protein Psuf_004400 [Phytohabitans suffuscus]
MLRAQYDRFEGKFGRPPGPDDPLFFDPDADEPTPLTTVDLERHSVATLEALGISPAWIYATQHTDGLLPMLDGTFRSDEDRREWDAAIARYLRTHPGLVVDPNEEIRKLRIGASATSLRLARDNPSYAASLIERMQDTEREDHGDGHLVRTLLQGMASELVHSLAADPAALAVAKEHARAWGGAELAEDVERTVADSPDEAALPVLLAAFAATGAQSQHDEDEDDHEDNDDLDFDVEAANVCEELVGAVLDQDRPDIPRNLITSLVELDEDDGGPLIAMLIVNAMGYLVSMREAKITSVQLNDAVAWVAANFGGEYAGATAIASSLAGHPEGEAFLAEHRGVTEVTVNHLSETLDIDFFPAMIWLCAGMVATAGDGDTEWLHRYRAGQ